MTSPIRQNLFERECDMPLLEARHLALLLLGLDASQPANALPEEHQENYRILHDAISRTIKATGMVSAPANKRMFYADEMFALAWRRHCCKVSDEAAFCLIQRPYISKTLLTRRISPRGSP